jgi:hypothetical protein
MATSIGGGDAPWGDETVQAIAFRPITDNLKVLHHWILYFNSSRGLTGGGTGGSTAGGAARTRPIPTSTSG